MINHIKQLITSFFVDINYISPSTLSLNDTTIIITGASRGIGKAISNVLYREGAYLILISRNISKQSFFSQWNKERYCLIDADITDSSDIQMIKKTLIEKYKKIDVLINNAGQFLDKPLEDINEYEFDSLIDTNVKSAFTMSKIVIPFMKKQKNGLIINIGSKISHNTNVAPLKVLYSTSKYAIEGFSLALNKELKSYGIRVTCLMPGTVNTFISFKSKQYLSPFDVGQVILMIIKFKTIDFESIIFKSLKQNI